MEIGDGRLGNSFEVGGKILMVIAPNDFRDEEYFEPKRVFDEAGVKVDTASKGVQVAVSRFDRKVMISLDVSDAVVDDYVAVVFVGGGGALVYEKDSYIHDLINSFYSKGKLVCAICIAPRILGASGVLMGKNATMWNGDKKQKLIIENYGAEFSDVGVEEDGNIITANGPLSAEEFGKRIVLKLGELK